MIDVLSLYLGNIVLYAAALFYCLVISFFVAPLIIEHLFYYAPRLFLLARAGDVYKRSVIITILESIGWAVLVVGIYGFLYITFPDQMYLITVSTVALLAWAVGLLNLIIRAVRFNKVVRRDFYYNAYMHYITPEALQAYQVFIESLDDMTNTQLLEQEQLGKELPYMHRQALDRKLNERGLERG